MEQDLALILQGIIGFIMLIVFLVMASNIAKIKRHFVEPSTRDFTRDINLALFKGEKNKALDLYYDLAFILVNQNDFHQDNARKLDQISIKIKDLGGNIPEEIKAFIEKYR